MAISHLTIRAHVTPLTRLMLLSARVTMQNDEVPAEYIERVAKTVELKVESDGKSSNR